MGNNNTARQTGAKGAPAVSATPTAEVEKRAADAGVVSPDRNTPEETPIPETGTSFAPSGKGCRPRTGLFGC